MSWEDSLGNMTLLDKWRSEAGCIYEQEKSFHTVTLSGKSLKRRENCKMTYGQIPGLDKTVARLVHGADRNYTIPYTETMFDHYFELGGNCFDTSEGYGSGTCERNLGAWIKLRDIRKEVIVIDKGGNPPEGTPEGIRRQLDKSLERMQMGMVDIYLMHRDNEKIPVGEFVDVLNQIRDEGLCQVFGVSNWSLKRLMEAEKYAIDNRKDFFTILSNQFSLAQILDAFWNCPGSSQQLYWATCRDTEFQAWLEKKQMILMPWSSQSSGFFGFNSTAVNEFHIRRCWYNELNVELRKRVHEIASAKKVSPNNVALAWVLSQKFPVFPIIGPRRPDETTDCIKALQIKLSSEEISWVNVEDFR